jgi:hypothetical protein
MSGDLTITSLSLDLDEVFDSTYWGGKSLDFITSFAFDGTGKIYLTGGTYSDNFPTSQEAYKRTLEGETDGFLTIIDESLSKIQYSTYVGGNFADQVNSLVVLDAENVILVGETKSPDFPVTADASTGRYIGGKSDGFVMRFSLKANKPAYSSFVGGTKGDTVTDVIMTDKRKLVLVGKSASGDFPVTADALYNTIEGGMDLVMLRLDRSLKNIEYATFGGGSKQVVMAPRVHYAKGDKLLIAFTCVSPDFPVTRRFVEPNSQWTNCLMQIDLEMGMGVSIVNGRAAVSGSGQERARAPWGSGAAAAPLPQGEASRAAGAVSGRSSGRMRPLRRFVWPSQVVSDSSSTVAAVGIGPRHGSAPAPEADSGRFPRLQPAGVLCG